MPLSIVPTPRVAMTAPDAHLGHERPVDQPETDADEQREGDRSGDGKPGLSP